MIETQSPLTISEVLFCSIGSYEKECSAFVEQFVFDRRHDFVVDPDFCGIAAKISLDRKPSEKGIRRRLSLTLIDTTMRCEVATQQIMVTMKKDQFFKDIHICFLSDTVEMKARHTYKLLVCDATAAETLAAVTFHLYGREYGNPEDWYTVADGGVQPSWDIFNLYKSLKTIHNHDYYARFNIIPNFGARLPEILPELEVRLHYPDGSRIDVRFMEPLCYDFDNNSYFVQCPLETTPDHTGIFYAEVLCMQYALAGFVFDTTRDDISGRWYGRQIEPLESYSPEAAALRLNQLLSADGSYDPFDQQFDEALDRFIQSQMDEAADHSPDYTDDKDEADETDEADEAEVGSDDEETTAGKSSPALSLDQLTGLAAVKEKLAMYERLVRFNKMRCDSGFRTVDTPLHAMFLGSPGTGKTTVAKLMGQMLKEAGVLSKGHVVVRERATLLGMYYSSESENTLKALEEARGGILFIDEAYQLFQPHDPKDPGKFVIETLLSALADDSNRDWMLILAGYTDEMKQLFELNPGLKSRIPESNTYHFSDFSADELMEIADRYLARHEYTLSEEAHTALAERLRHDHSHRDKKFGNARHVVNLIQTEILPAMAMRVTAGDGTDIARLSEIHASDIPPYKPVCIDTNRPQIGYCA